MLQFASVLAPNHSTITKQSPHLLSSNMCQETPRKSGGHKVGQNAALPMDSPPRFKAAHRHHTFTTTAHDKIDLVILEKQVLDVFTFNCKCIHECNAISSGLLSMRQAFISAYLPHFFHGAVRIYFGVVFDSAFLVSGGGAPPPRTDVTYIYSWHRDPVCAPTNWQRLFRSETQRAAEPQTTGCHSLRNPPHSSIHFNYLIHLLCNLHNLFNVSYNSLRYRCGAWTWQCVKYLQPCFTPLRRDIILII